MAGLENYLPQMIIKRKQYILCKNQVATSKVKFTVRTYCLCIGLNECYSCPAHNFVVGSASGMVQYRDLVFHPFVQSHQGAILLKALGRGICVPWTHFSSSYTPGIYAARYIVFALTFVRSSVRMFVRSCVRSFVTFRHVRIYIKVFG